MNPTIGQFLFYYLQSGGAPVNSAKVTALNADGTVKVLPITPTPRVEVDNVGVWQGAGPVDASGYENGCVSDIGLTPVGPAHWR